ncbi:MAG: phenylalanine--tRNA ligase beta subunit-related protein [Streptococcus sp.]
MGERLQKSLKSLVVSSLKQLSSVAKSIRKTSGRLNLRSESSSRFEKGINVATVNEALDAAASMIARACW